MREKLLWHEKERERKKKEITGHYSSFFETLDVFKKTSTI
jgi:hypothetical protein